MTEKKILRNQRNAEIAEKYKKLSTENPSASRSRIAATLAEVYGLTMMGIYNILVKEGIW